jgi:diguanylate cyclase (GGDEF)-like protein
MIDVDHCNSVNDRFGHPIGDEVIRRVADTLGRDFLGREDFVARYGGEEFVVMVPGSSAHAVRQRADRVRQAIAEIGFSKGTEHFSVTAAVRVAVLAFGSPIPWPTRCCAMPPPNRSSQRFAVGR